MIRRLLLLLLVSILACCSSESSDELGGILLHDKLVLGESIPYQQIEQDYYSSYSSGGVDVSEVELIVYRSEDEFAQFWSLHKAGTKDEYGNLPAMPEVDFDMDMVIVVMSPVQSSGGYNLEVDDVYDNGDEITVSATLEEPGSSCVVTCALCQPCVIIAVEKSNSPLSLDLTRTVDHCNENLL